MLAATTDGKIAGICGCCSAVDGDFSYKLVSFCEFCKAWLCDACRGNPWKRVQAMLKWASLKRKT